jgi:hypothetical protein
MNASIIQNPADPDATYRKKVGAEYRGYIANVIEQADDEKSLVIDYQFEQNTYSDSQFLKDYIERQPDSSEKMLLITDGGYCGNENTKLVASKNIKLVTTNLKGADVIDLWAEFEFNQEGTEILCCAGGHAPKSSVYDKNTQKCKASFLIETYQICPHFKQCKPVIHKRVATINLAQRTAYHAQQQRLLQTSEFKSLAKYRNGVETIPAALRRRHHKIQCLCAD